MINLEYILTQNSILIAILALFSLIKIFLLVKNVISNAIKTLLPGYNLIERYGKDSYAVISACTDGIGKGFAIELARQGFNIVMLVRDPIKAKNVSEEIREITRTDTKFKILQIDFQNSLGKGEIERVCREMQDLDISLLINNVGMAIETRCFEQIKEEELLKIVNMNIGAQLLLTNKLIQKLRIRKNKGGIISISSLASLYPIAGFAVYCATKKFNDYLSRSLAEEYRGEIDILSLRPSWVISPMTEKFLKHAQNVITPEQCAKAALRDLGKFDQTEGHSQHVIARIKSSLFRSKSNQYMRNQSLSLRKKNE